MIVTSVVEKLRVAIPVLKPNVPDKVPRKLPVPAGETWKIFKVKLPAIAGPNKFAGTVVVTTTSPNCAPAGVFTGLVVPLKVKVVVPFMFVKLTTFMPEILKTPVVLKVTGSARKAPWPSATTVRATRQNNRFLTAAADEFLIG